MGFLAILSKKARETYAGGQNEMDLFSVQLTGSNSLMDWGLWLVLIGLVAIYFWLAFRRKK